MPFPVVFFLMGLEPVFTLSTFADPNDGDRWTAGTSWVDFAWLEFQLFTGVEAGTFVLVDCVLGSWLAPKLRRALKASRNDWFCSITSGVEKFVDSLAVVEWMFSGFRELEENVELFENVLRVGDRLLLARLNILENVHIIPNINSKIFL